jgi:hypothetical protein
MTRTDRAAVLRGAGIVATAVLALRVAPLIVRRVQDLRLRTLAQIETVARTRSAVAAAASLRDSLPGVLGRVVALAPQLVDGRSRAEAGAALASWLSTTASRSAVRLRGVEPVPDSGKDLVNPVRVRAEIEGDVNGIAAFLLATESGAPLLTVENLAVAALDPASPPSGAEVLRVSFEVSGWYLPGDRP